MWRLFRSIVQAVGDLLRPLMPLAAPQLGDPLRTIAFDAAANAYLIRDRQMVVRDVLHTQQPVLLMSPTPVDAAAGYLLAHVVLLGLDARQLQRLKKRPEADLTDDGVEFRLFSEKTQFDVTTVTFQQTCWALPTWQAAISVHLKQLPTQFAVLCAQISRQDKLSPIGKPPDADIERLKKLNEKVLAAQLGIVGGQRFESTPLKILYKRLMMYVYRADKRTPDMLRALGLPLPPVPPDIIDGHQYVVAAVYFNMFRKDLDATQWVALVEARTQAVLYAEEIADCLGGGAPGARGMVFEADPITTNAGPPPTARNSELNPLRVSTVLPNLNQANPQRLVGSSVQVQNFDIPVLPHPEYDPPTETPFGAFDYDVRTNQFAAVNAYYHCDRFFRFVEEQGFDRDDYFPGTTFPLMVDHRGTPTRGGGPESVQAQCRGKIVDGPNGEEIGGIKNVIFCVAEAFPDTPIGIALDWRVVLHELGGHGTLQNHVNSSNFGFAHSAGDSFAAILNDPESQAPDKGWTFPWVQYDRHHDRQVIEGWFWDGPKDINDGPDQLWREQILSTTHFNAYKALGGGASMAATRWFAANTMSYLMLRAIQTLTPPTNSQHASDWLCNMIVADATNWTPKGLSGGAYEKVIYWSFTQQGLFGGTPPMVDVYIDDGRAGQYCYQGKHAECPAIWNRLAPDGEGEHQPPVPGVVNYGYVKVCSYGMQAATSVTVKAFQNTSQISRNYPDDFAPMQTAQRFVGDLPSLAKEMIVGPFEWIPVDGDNYMLMAVSALGDASNLDKFSAGQSIADWRLVPNDNNLGLRKA